MCTYAEEAWHQEAYSEKEGGKFAEAGPPPVGSGVDTGVAGQVSQAHHPLRAARRHPRGLCAVGLFFNLLQPSLVRVLKGSLRSDHRMSYRMVPRNLRPDLWTLRLCGVPSWTVLVAVRAEHGHQDTDTRLQSLLAPFRGKAVDPLVGLGAGHVLERLAEAILQALDAVLTPPLDGQRLQEVDLALARLPSSTPFRGGRLLRMPVRSILLDGALGRVSRRILSPPADRSRPASRGRALGGRSGVVAIGELFEGGGADVHGVTQGTGLRPGLGHPDQVRGDVAPDVLGTRIPDA